MQIIPQSLNINNLRTTSAKAMKYSLKTVFKKAMLTFTIFEILLFECRSVLSPTQWGTGSDRAKSVLFYC